MTQIDKINVSLHLEGEKYQVGELVKVEKEIYFRYRSEFLDTGLNLSPIKLPFDSAIRSAPPEPFEGLFGVFNDSLPDSWGRLLLDWEIKSRNIDITQITPLDRLAYVGTQGMGALVYTPDFQTSKDLKEEVNLNMLEGEIAAVLKGESSELLEELYIMGGSSGGGRPKIFVSYNPTTNELSFGPGVSDEDFEDWIIKFRASVDNPEIAKIEYAYHLMAVAAGIKMSECRLFEGRSGRLYFGTKRFDRKEGKRYHVHTASGLMHDSYNTSLMDYGHLMDCAFRLEKHVKAYEKIFRLAAFNVFAHNRDDHSKNFSFLLKGDGQWQFAPAYDLTFSFSAYGYHSTMIAGESRNPGEEDLMKLAEHFGLAKAGLILEEVKTAVSGWETTARELVISKDTIKTISGKLKY